MKPPPSDDEAVGVQAAEAWARLQATSPLVHVMTNIVAAELTANALLAVGASPVMALSLEEAPEVAARADALVVNIGTLASSAPEAMRAAIAAAAQANTPWAYDPVGAGGSAHRTRVAQDLLSQDLLSQDLAAHRPVLIRANASEIRALAGETHHGGGVAAEDPVEAAAQAASSLADRLGAAVFVSGEVDFVTHGGRRAWIAGGDRIMTRVTAIGCSLTAICGALLGAGADRFSAALAAAAAYARAGETAMTRALGPGTFTPHFLDALSQLTADDIAAARIGDAN